MNTDRDFLIVAMDKFILATCDSGCKDTLSAVSKLLDNSLQAGSTEISVTLALDERNSMHPIVLGVLDNDSGMDARTLRTALRLGDSTRFDNRRGTDPLDFRTGAATSPRRRPRRIGGRFPPERRRFRSDPPMPSASVPPG